MSNGHEKWLKLKTPSELRADPPINRTPDINGANTRYPHLVVSYPTMTEIREQYFTNLSTWLKHDWPYLKSNDEARQIVLGLNASNRTVKVSVPRKP